jgi:DNA-directed RNA polymerase subunit beta'
LFGFAEPREKKQVTYSAMRVQLASPETIRQMSHGEVTKPETINYRTFKPEKDGLFCEKIFGPVKDWECNCGKYKRIRYRGVICDRCGVEVTQAKVRRERMGHIELAVPVSHIWYFKGVPSRIGYMLDMSVRDLERVLYYESYIVINPGDTPLKEKQLISEEEYLELREEYGDSFEAEMGALAIKKLLQSIDVEELSAELRAHAKVETSVQRKKEILKRLKVVEAFRQSKNRPDWMILEVVPVLPPDLRPLVPLEGGRFATSDLNDLYRRVINRTNRLKKLIEIKAPEVILRNEKRMLQEAVDALFDNGRRSRAVRGPGNRPLKSLSDMLKGKQGRFRQNLLGKRVDYSGRSVIVVGPELKLHECGLPKSMALELFKPFIIKRLEDKGYVQTVKSAKKLVEREKPEVWDILEEIIQDHPVMLNRAPTLHRLGIQAFQPVLVEGKAIRLHPLVCTAFNADFDGDQMAVHLPLSFEAQLEARVLMLSSNNILSTANGRPIMAPTQDMVLGCYYLTMGLLPENERRTPRSFGNRDEVLMAVDTRAIRLHEKVRVRINGETMETTPGRVIFNEILPDDVAYMNHPLDKKSLENLVHDVHRKKGRYRTALFLDQLKNVGFHYATKAGITVGIDDVRIPDQKEAMISSTHRDVEKIFEDYSKGNITDSERYNKIIDTWTKTTNSVSEVMFGGLSKDQGGFNPVYMMAVSGARGSREQIRQLAGMRGLMAKPQKKLTGSIGEIIEQPIISNFREGLTVLEYFISTHGARKGLADTALKTADAGYLTRRLVDISQDVIISEEDCGTIMGIDTKPLKEAEEVIEPLADRILGRVLAEDVIDPISDKVVYDAGSVLDEDLSEEIQKLQDERGLDSVSIRSVLTCESRRGVCAKCYGRNLGTGKVVNVGEAVGVIAAQSIGEPGTQLTLRTFHIGGTAMRLTEQSLVEAKTQGTVHFVSVRTVKDEEDAVVAIGHHGEVEIRDDENRIRARYGIPYGAKLLVSDNQKVKAGVPVFEWDPYASPILTDRNGMVRFVDIVDEVTVRDELDEKTGLRQRVIIEHKEKSLHPHIHILDKAGRPMVKYPIPTGARILVHDEEHVKTARVLAKIPREISKTRDITGGLPRVAELFEARKPKDAAVVTEIDGTVEFGGVSRGFRKVLVKGDGIEHEYLVPQGKHLLVHENDVVRAGDKLCDGRINPHDILKIKGINAVQEYLLNEIQEVYRLQGVKINDKHIEVIVRQMLQKVRIEDPGDTNFLEGDMVEKSKVRDENDRVEAEGGTPATYQPLLLGITKASLSTESFISAASFQETTRVLTEAAIQGSKDTLVGLKENVIMGNLIPAGTGVNRLKAIQIIPPADEVDEEPAEAAAVNEEPGMPMEKVESQGS